MKAEGRRDQAKFLIDYLRSQGACLRAEPSGKTFGLMLLVPFAIGDELADQIGKLKPEIINLLVDELVDQLEKDLDRHIQR